MGEAKRRKRAGTYPEAGPVEHYRVPDGKFAITLEVAGANHPMTFIFPAEQLAELMQRAHQAWPPGLAFGALVRGLAEEFIAGQNTGRDLAGVGIGTATTALYHPQHGAAVRAAVSHCLRDDGRAHVTWTLNPNGLAIAVASRFVELDALLSRTPPGQLLVMAEQPPEGPMQ